MADQVPGLVPDSGGTPSPFERRVAIADKPVMWILGVLMLIAAAVGSAVAWWQYQAPARLDLQYESSAAVFQAGAERPAKLRMLYDDRPVAAPFLVVGSVTNNGGREFPSTRTRPGPVESAPRITFGGARVLDAYVVSTHPEAVSAEAVQVGNRVEFRHGVMNRGHGFTFHVVCDGKPRLPRFAYQVAAADDPRTLAAESLASESGKFHLSMLFGYAGVAGFFLFCVAPCVKVFRRAPAMFRRDDDLEITMFLTELVSAVLYVGMAWYVAHIFFHEKRYVAIN